MTSPAPPPDPALPAPAPLLEQGSLTTADGHQLPYELSGTRDGAPALYLHGGPGGTLGSGYRRNVPADGTLLVGMLQRRIQEGSPGGGLAAQTTANLVGDIELLREHLGIESWIVQGVSWGSTLALAYAQAHPHRVRAVVLFAVTTTSRWEVDWITEGVGALYPEAWDALATLAEQRTQFRRGPLGHGRAEGSLRLVDAYRDMLADPDPQRVCEAAAAWIDWEDAHIGIGLPHPGTQGGLPRSQVQQLEFARLVTHYWAHDGFVADWAAGWGAEPGSGLLGGMHRLAGVPGVLIHGRRDVSGPVRTPYLVHRAWPGSTLRIIEHEGHGGPEMAQLWRAVMTELTGSGRAPSGRR